MYSGIITRISLSICLATAIILLIMVSVVLVDYDGGYSNFIQSQAITQKNMQFAIIVASLVLICVTALISWGISLYGSFRIAGPLYRFTQNFAHCNETDRMLDIRSDDCLQDLSVKIIDAAKQIDHHKQALLNHINQCDELLKLPEEHQDKAKLAELLQQLKQLETRARLNE